MPSVREIAKQVIKDADLPESVSNILAATVLDTSIDLGAPDSFAKVIRQIMQQRLELIRKARARLNGIPEGEILAILKDPEASGRNGITGDRDRVIFLAELQKAIRNTVIETTEISRRPPDYH